VPYLSSFENCREEIGLKKWYDTPGGALFGALFALIGTSAAAASITYVCVKNARAGVAVHLGTVELTDEAPATEEEGEVIDLAKLPVERSSIQPPPRRAARPREEDVNPTPWRVYLEETPEIVLDEVEPADTATGLRLAAEAAARRGERPPGVFLEEKPDAPPASPPSADEVHPDSEGTLKRPELARIAADLGY